MGFALKGVKEKRFKEIIKKLAKLELKFISNISEYKDFVEIEEEDLKKLPEFLQKSLKKNKNGKYEVSINYIEAIPFLENSTNDEKKKELIIKMSQKGGGKKVWRGVW